MMGTTNRALLTTMTYRRLGCFGTFTIVHFKKMCFCTIVLELSSRNNFLYCDKSIWNRFSPLFAAQSHKKTVLPNTICQLGPSPEADYIDRKKGAWPKAAGITSLLFCYALWSTNQHRGPSRRMVFGKTVFLWLWAAKSGENRLQIDLSQYKKLLSDLSSTG